MQFTKVEGSNLHKDRHSMTFHFIPKKASEMHKKHLNACQCRQVVNGLSISEAVSVLSLNNSSLHIGRNFPYILYVIIRIPPSSGEISQKSTQRGCALLSYKHIHHGICRHICLVMNEVGLPLPVPLTESTQTQVA